MAYIYLITNDVNQKVYIGKTELPNKIMIKEEIEDKDALELLLTSQAERKVEIKTPQKGEKLRLVEMAENNFTGIFDVNVFGCYRINKAFLPLLHKGSKVVITTSELAPLDPLPFTGIYAITKATLEKYAFSLRMELQLLGISVAVLRPGAVKTDMLGASTSQLDKFVASTQLYSCNATRFKKIVDKVETRNVSPQKVAKKTAKILSKRRPRYVYKLNRNPLLLMLNALPDRWQTAIIKGILK